MSKEVNKKRQIFCIFKATFDAKLLQMKNQGRKLQIMERLALWIDTHSDTLKMDQKRKNQFKKDLLDQAEAVLERRRCKLHQRQLSALKHYADPNMEYQKKINFIDGSIEKDIEFFDHKSGVMSEIRYIKDRMRKINSRKQY